MVFKTGLLEETGAADIGYAIAPLRVVHGDAAFKALSARGVDVRLKTRVEAVTPHHSSAAVTWDDGVISADALVLATPHDELVRLIPESVLPTGVEPQRLGRSPIVNLHVGYDRMVMKCPFAAGIRSPVQFVFDRTDSSGIGSGQLLAVSLSGADAYGALGVDELRATFIPALAALFPEAAHAQVTSFFVTREPEATFRGIPGTARHRPPAATIHPRVFLAGAWTDTGWPATMEGAVRSGLAAANAARQTVDGAGRRLAA
jgi:hypothetical protein